ncbi:MAG: CHAT domain-containing protein [bacterium]
MRPFIPTEVSPSRTLCITALRWLHVLLIAGHLPAQTSSSDTTFANSCFAKAEHFAKNAKYDSSALYYEKASTIYQTVAVKQGDLGMWEKFIRCYNGLGVVWRRKGNYSRALEYLDNALKVGLSRLGPQNLMVASCYHGLGVVYRFQGDNDKALEFFHKSLQIKLPKLGEQHAAVILGYNSIGNAYRARGDYDRALAYYRKSLQAGLQTLDREDPAISAYYNNIGVVYYDKGDYVRALEHFHKSLAIELKTLGETHPSLASNYNNIGNVYHDQDEFDKALEYHYKALNLRLEALGDRHIDVAESYFNIARVYQAQGKYDKSLEYHQRALALERQSLGEDHFLVAESYAHIGNVYYDRGDDDQALAYYHKAVSLQLQTLGERHPDIALTYQQIGMVYDRQKNIQKALDYYQKAIMTLAPTFRSEDVHANPELKQIAHGRNMLASLKLKGAALEKLARSGSSVGMKIKTLESALSTHVLGSQLMDQIRTGYHTEGSKLLLTADFAEIYKNGVQVAWQLYTLTQQQQYRLQAFLFMEKGQYAVLHDALQESRARKFAAIPDSLLEKERELRIDLAYFETELQRETEKAEAERNQQNLQKFQDRIFALSQEFEQLIERFETAFPDYYALKYRTQVSSVGELQNALDSRTALLEYFTGDSTLFITVISNGDFAILSLPLDPAFENKVDMFCKSLKIADPQDFLQTGAELHGILLRPIERYLAGKQKLVIIPGGLLHYVPFEALIASGSPATTDFRKVNYVIRKHEISYHYSATLFSSQFANRRQYKTNKIEQPASGFVGFAPVFADGEYGLGSWLTEFSSSGFVKSLLNFRSVTLDGKHFNALKYSEQEVQGISALFARSRLPRQSYFRAEASEENFKTNTANRKYVHVATHGLLNEEKPELSGLIFSQPADSTAAEDGVLYPAECYNLDLNADLLVLSSCESGVGKLVKGEGLMALTRGILYSGARNIIHSLWKVDDKHTSELMVELYRNILAGKNYAAALRAAKLKLIENERTAFPASWSSFVLVGN